MYVCVINISVYHHSLKVSTTGRELMRIRCQGTLMCLLLIILHLDNTLDVIICRV